MAGKPIRHPNGARGCASSTLVMPGPAFRIALADALIRRDQSGEARAELAATISTLLRRLEKRPAAPPPHDLLALGYAKLAIALRQTGENDKADEAARKAEQERNSVH